jgi:hypothetical protein
VVFQLVAELDKPCGYERSFKISEQSLLANRFMLGVDTKEMTEANLLGICSRLGMPQDHLEEFERNLPDANLALFGFEDCEGSCNYKVYLEYWEKLTKELPSKPNKTEPVVLHLGFKWDVLDNTKATIAHYTCYPLLNIDKILERLSRIYRGYHDRASHDIARAIIELAASRIRNDSPIYLEAAEDNNPRKSFDVNMYKANLRMCDLYPSLVKAAEHFSIPAEKFDRLNALISKKMFGHLSGGIDKKGRDFLTFYYEVT